VNKDAGTLFVVSTPIGNLKDITIRAIDVLKEADVIISEDTRETSKILNNFNIKKEQLIYTDQKHIKMLPVIISLLESKKNVAIVCDSGTPTISDPGYKLINYLRTHEYNIQSIPGPNAAIAALSISGLPTDKFLFLGFLPKSSSARRILFEKYSDVEATLTIYESPYRITRLLKEVELTMGNRVVSIVKDITKYYEFVVTDYVTNINNHLVKMKEKGEYVVLIAKKDFNLNG